MAILSKLFGLIYWMEAKGDKEAEVKNLRLKIAEIAGEKEMSALEENFKNRKSELLFEAEITFQDSEKLAGEIEEMLLSLEEDEYKEKFVSAMDELHKAENAKDKAKILEILQKCHDITAKLTQLSKRKK
jgi:hypothetical protein